MAFQSAPECAEAVIHFVRTTQNMYNVLNFWSPGGYVQADLDALAAVVDAGVGADYMPVIDSNTTYLETTVRGLENVIDLSAVDAASTGAGGDTAGGGLPANASLCITLRTGFTGRSARGRFYAVPPTNAKLATADTYTSAYGNALNDFLQNLKSDAAGIGWNMVILSRRTGGSLRPVATHLNVTTISYRNLLIDSARRRLIPGH